LASGAPKTEREDLLSLSLVHIRCTTIFGFSSLIFWLRLYGEILRVLPAAIFLIAAPILLHRQQRRLQFWFLAPAPTEKKFAPRLAGGRNWEPILWILAYTMLWMWMLNMKE
jgi:uncharacterized membrane protein YbaN (DUF454 family)